jgi:phage terminase large subunit-like protein
MVKTPQIRSERAQRCGAWIASRIDQLRAAGAVTDITDDAFSSELAIWERIVEFPFADYPDYTAPWHIFQWPHMRWDHVYQVISLIETFRQATGGRVGQPMKLMHFQVMMVLAWLGPEDPETGLRIIRDGLATFARKSGKTSLVAAIVTALLCLHPDEHGLRGQEIQVGAADREQAGITFHMANMYVAQDQELGIAEKFKATPSKKLLMHRSTLSHLRCLSSDIATKHGGAPLMVLLDEIGNVRSDLAADFFSVLTTGYGAQLEPLTLQFSTQAPSDTHFFSEQVDRVKRINEGMLEDEQTAGFVFAIPEQDEDGVDFDVFDERWWYLGSPGIDVITSRQDMRNWAKKARETPSLENHFRVLRCNQRTSENAAFVTRTVWERNSGAFDQEDLIGRRCWLGLDLSETTDLTALVAVFEPLHEGETMPVLPFFWIPGEGLIERGKRDKVPYKAWSDAGLINTESSVRIDYALVAEKIDELNQLYDVGGFGYDRYKMKRVRAALEDLNYKFEEKNDPWLREIGQGFVSQTTTVQLLEEFLLEGTLAHGSNPILKWNAANAVIQKDPAGNRKFNKANSYGRIDGLVALGISLHVRFEVMTSADGPSVYSDESRAMFM